MKQFRFTYTALGFLLFSFPAFSTDTPIEMTAEDSSERSALSVKYLLSQHRETFTTFNEKASQRGQEKEAALYWQEICSLNKVISNHLVQSRSALENKELVDDEKSIMVEAIAAISTTESYDIIVNMAHTQGNRSPTQLDSLWRHDIYSFELGKRLFKLFDAKTFEEDGSIADWDVDQTRKASYMVLGVKTGIERLYRLTQMNRLNEHTRVKDFEKIYQEMTNLEESFDFPYIWSGIVKRVFRDEEKMPFRQFIKKIYEIYNSSIQEALSKDDEISLDHLYEVKKRSKPFKIGYGVLNKSAESYLAENSSDPKLIIACGHVQNPKGVTIADQFNLKGCPYHEHSGWYTVDLNFALQPDFVADFLRKEPLDYLGSVFEEKLKVIYGEGALAHVFWAKQAIPMMYKALRKGGHIVSHYGNLSQEDLIQKLTSSGFQKEKIHFYKMPRCLGELKDGLLQFPEWHAVNTIEECNLKLLLKAMSIRHISCIPKLIHSQEEFTQTIENTPATDGMPLEYLNPQVIKKMEMMKEKNIENSKMKVESFKTKLQKLLAEEYEESEISEVQQVIENFKILKSIDPLFEFNFPSYDEYVIVEK